MTAPGYFDRHGQPITREEWVEQRDAAERRGHHFILDRSEIGMEHHPLGALRSTIITRYFGVELGRDGAQRPLIFESMVLDGPLDGERDRYATESEARAGHFTMVEKVAAAMLSRLDLPFSITRTGRDTLEISVRKDKPRPPRVPDVTMLRIPTRKTMR